jgi:hypothetical protein
MLFPEPGWNTVIEEMDDNLDSRFMQGSNHFIEIGKVIAAFLIRPTYRQAMGINPYTGSCLYPFNRAYPTPRNEVDIGSFPITKERNQTYKATKSKGTNTKFSILHLISFLSKTSS